MLEEAGCGGERVWWRVRGKEGEGVMEGEMREAGRVVWWVVMWSWGIVVTCPWWLVVICHSGSCDMAASHVKNEVGAWGYGAHLQKKW